MITVHKMVYLLPCNKTTKKLRIIFNKLLLQTVEKSCQQKFRLQKKLHYYEFYG